MAAKKRKNRSVHRPPRPADRMSWAWGLVANLAVLAVYFYYSGLAGRSAEVYYRAVQEDEPLEWASFWAFAAAGALFAVAAWRRRRQGSGAFGSGLLASGFLGLVALFCVFVAGEEISWGQRLLSFRPPEYFLAENFQQELNVHNLVDSDLRKLGLRLVILAYGVLLPLLASSRKLRGWMERLGVVAPSWMLMPAFIAMERIYAAYPLRFTGEVVEMMFGLGMLIAAMALLHGPDAGGEGRKGRWQRLAPALPLAALVAVFLLGAATSAASQALSGGDEGRLERARQEAEALASDFKLLGAARGRPSLSQCNLSKRIFTYVEEYGEPALLEGSYAGLTGQGLPEERADFFLDPWNNPWWIRDRCDPRAGVRRAFVYSFGPNKRRDSSQWEIRGDDVGAWIVEIGTLPAWLAGDDADED